MTAVPSLRTSHLFLPPYFELEGFADLKLAGDKVDFIWMIPITEAEREFAMEHGSRAQEQRFEEADMSPVLDESRRSIA